MKYEARSPDDPSPKGLAFPTLAGAQRHCLTMDEALLEWPKNWNTSYWKSKPRPWQVEECA